ncbi:flavin reductase family protein [Actinomyces sp. MRS3W]|uniref:flavin reductase family protein n=1 Tax=Actinomyces sp. MRS3W TaxID=2800796 RepID=UPI0028FDA016|nr:flavin reductase family protein [Actinomyces sp. MRS3W]MDU0348356.1 flavin reductase family protein [Actinomyces sp. MRS3W]
MGCTDSVSPFCQLPTDKWQWHPSPLAGQIVYVTTRSDAGEVNLAPKSWVSMAAFHGPIIGFGCSRQHQTYTNATATGMFTINFPTAEQAGRAAQVADAPREFRLRASGLSLDGVRTSGVPHLRECPAYMECHLVKSVEFDGGETFLFGKIDVIAIHRELSSLPIEEAYARLAPAFFCEPGVIGELRPLTTTTIR